MGGAGPAAPPRSTQFCSARSRPPPGRQTPHTEIFNVQPFLKLLVSDCVYLLVSSGHDVVAAPLWEEVDEVLRFMASPDQLERRLGGGVLGPGVADDRHHGGPSLSLPPHCPAASALLPSLGVGGLPALPEVETHSTVQQEQGCKWNTLLDY